jgi:hypothetical protein
MHKWIHSKGMTLFMKIAEPRFIRIVQFCIYVGMLIAGIFILMNPPTSFQGVIALNQVYVLGSFIAIGSIFGMIAVLPGIWWLERTGLLSLGLGLVIYLIIIIAMGRSSLMGITIPLLFMLTFVQRWSEIRRFQLAPRER